MNYSIFRITLDIHRHQSQVSIPVMYGDTAVRLLVTLSDGGTPYTIGKSCWAQFVAEKPDVDEPLLRNCIIENGTTIRLDFDNGIADVAGVYNCEIRLYGAEGKITSPCFTMVVDPRVVADYVGDDMAANGFIDQIGTTMAAFLEAEEKRDTAETARDTAEQERATAEKERETAEVARQTAEEERKTAYNEIDEKIANKVEKEDGKGLSSNDFSDAYKKILENSAKSSYKALFTQYGTDDGDGKGYIAISIPSNSVIEIDIDEDYNADHSHSYLQVACGGYGHFHKVLVNSTNCKVYAYADNFGGNGTWYIPWQLNMSGVGVSVSARCVSDANIDYVSGEWIWGTPSEAEWWSEITEHYATQANLEKTIQEATTCKFDMVNGSRGRMPLNIGTWFCMHLGGEDKILLRNPNGNIRKDYREKELPTFQFGIITISDPWKESYWNGMSSAADGYGRLHCSLLAKVGNEMKSFYWREYSDQPRSLLEDTDGRASDVISCFKIG